MGWEWAIDLPHDYEFPCGAAMGVARESRVDLSCLIAKGQSMNRGDQQPVVIVIDDDQLVREAVSDLLRSVGLQTKMFASVPDFLKWKLPDAPSCLVLDVRLPGLSGLDFQSELNKERARIPIVFMTGHGDIPMSVRAMKGGAVDFLSKPFRDQDMIDAVQAGLEQDRGRRKTVNVTVQLKSAFDSFDGPGTGNHEARHCGPDEQANRRRVGGERRDGQVSPWQRDAKDGRKVGCRTSTNGRCLRRAPDGT